MLSYVEIVLDTNRFATPAETYVLIVNGELPDNLAALLYRVYDVLVSPEYLHIYRKPMPLRDLLTATQFDNEEGSFCVASYTVRQNDENILGTMIFRKSQLESLMSAQRKATARVKEMYPTWDNVFVCVDSLVYIIAESLNITVGAARGIVYDYCGYEDN